MSTLLAYGTSANDSILHEHAVYATCRTAASGTTRNIADNSQVNLIVGQGEIPGFSLYTIFRTYLFFDTSNGGANPLANSIITSATLSIYSKNDSGGEPITGFDLVVQNGQPTYPSSSIVLTDYNYLYYQGSSIGGLVSLPAPGGAIAEQVWDIPLNSNGLSWINKTGTTKFCLRNKNEIAGTAPSVNSYQRVQFWAEQKGTIYRPYLTVEYTVLSALPAQSTIKF